MDSDPSPRGHFQVLPPEIRFMIWDYFYPQGYGRGKTDFAILRTSSTLYHEITIYLKWPQSLGRFEIDVSPGRDSPLRIYNLSRSICWKLPVKWFSTGPGITGFDHLPIDRLSTVVNIPAPIGQEVWGEIISMYEKCLALVKIFNWVKLRSVRLLVLELRDTQSTSWIVRPSHLPDEVHPIQSFPATMNFNGFPYFRSDDIAMVVNPFYLLRRVSHVRIQLGITSIMYAQAGGYHTTIQSRLSRDQRNIRISTPSKVAFCESKMSLEFLIVQSVLDGAQGPMANFLRLERFIDWSEQPQAVENALLDLIYRCKDEIRHNNMVKTVQMDLWTRFGLMRLIDPALTSWQLHAIARPYATEEDRLRAGLNEILFGERSSSAVWNQAYFTGIPPFSDRLWNQKKFELVQMLNLLDYRQPWVRETFVGRLFNIEF